MYTAAAMALHYFHSHTPKTKQLECKKIECKKILFAHTLMQKILRNSFFETATANTLVGPLDIGVQKNTKMGKITAIFSLHTNLLYTINKSLELLVLIEYSMKNATIDFFTSN
jgi:hypothetical protein